MAKPAAVNIQVKDGTSSSTGQSEFMTANQRFIFLGCDPLGWHEPLIHKSALLTVLTSVNGPATNAFAAAVYRRYGSKSISLSHINSHAELSSCCTLILLLHTQQRSAQAHLDQDTSINQWHCRAGLACLFLQQQHRMAVNIAGSNSIEQHAALNSPPSQQDNAPTEFGACSLDNSCQKSAKHEMRLHCGRQY